MSNQKLKSDEFLKKLVKKMLLEQNYSPSDNFLEDPFLAEPGNPDSDGMTPQQIDDVVWEKPPPELVSDSNFRAELRKYCGDKYVEGEFNIDAGEYYQKNPGEKCQWYSYLWNSGFPNQSKWPGAIDLNQYLEQARDMYNNPKKYISQVQGAEDDEDVKNWAVENWIYRREQFFNREYRRKQAEIGSNSGKPAWSTLRQSAGSFMSYFYKLFTEDAQEFVRDQYRGMKLSSFDNNHQLAVVSLKREDTEGVGGTNLERVRSHMLLFNQYTYSNKKVFAEKLAKTYGKGVEKFVPAAWDPNFYGINKEVLSYIVDFFKDKEPVLKRKLYKTQKRMPGGEVSTNLGKVQEAYMSLFKSFRFGLEMVLGKLVTGGQNTGAIGVLNPSYYLGFEIFKDESYVQELIRNMSRVFHFGSGGWDGTNQTHGGFPGIQESTTSVVGLDLNDRVLNRVLGLSEQNTWTGGRDFNIPSTSGTFSNKSPEQREREAEKKEYDKVSKPYGKEVDGRWNPLVLFLLTLRGLDFYSGKQPVGGQRKRVRGLSTRKWLRNSKDGPFFSKNSETRKRAMVRFIGEYSRRVPSEFFNEYYINDVFIPSILDDTDFNEDSIPDKREFLVNWVAFQRAAIYDPTSEIAQNASRNWGAYGDQKITVDKTGKQKQIPKGYAYFYEWSNDTFDLFEKKQTLEKISKYNTNIAMGILYGTAEWMGGWFAVEKAFLAAEGFIKAAADKAALRATNYSRIPGMLRTIALGPVAGRHISVFMRNAWTAGFFIAAFVILDFWGIWDVSEDFKEKYEKIKDITCEFRDLINSLDTNDTKQFLAVKGSRAVLERIYENMIVAYSELIVLYTQTINKAGSQGVSRRDFVLYERFKVIERLQYIQKYEMAIKKLFENCLEDVRAMKHDEEVTVLLMSLKDTGLDMDKTCEVLEKQVIQLATRADQCEDVDPDSMIKPPGCEYIPTGAPEKLTGFPAAKDLLRVRDAYDKTKDEIGSIMSAIKSNTDLKPALSPIDAFDGAMNLNRKPDPVGTWIMKGINAVEKLISPPEYFPEEGEEENNEGSMNESLSNNILLEANTSKLNSKLNKTLTEYYGKDFDGARGIAALKGLILEIQRPEESSVSKNNKDKTLAMAGADYRRYNSNVLKAADFEFRATGERAMAIKTVIQGLDKNFILQQGFKSKDFTNNSRFFGDKNESVFFSARFYNQFVKKPRGIDAVCPINYEFNESMGMCEVSGEARKRFFVSYSSDDTNYGFDEESLDFSGKEKFSTQGNILAGILEAAKRADSNTRSRIRPGGNLIDLDVVSEIYNQAVRKKGKLTATEAIIKKHIQLHVEDVDPKNTILFNVILPLLSTGCFHHAYSESDEKGSVIGKLPFLSVEDMENQIGVLNQILENFKTTVTPSQTAGNSGVVGVGPNPSGSTSNTASGSLNEEKVKNLLRFHIMLMTFLKIYVKEYMMRDYGYNKKIKRYLNNDQANPAELKSALVEKLTVFIRTGEISELFDKRFQGKQKLNFSNIKSINIK